VVVEEGVETTDAVCVCVCVCVYINICYSHYLNRSGSGKKMGSGNQTFLFLPKLMSIFTYEEPPSILLQFVFVLISMDMLDGI